MHPKPARTSSFLCAALFASLLLSPLSAQGETAYDLEKRYSKMARELHSSTSPTVENVRAQVEAAQTLIIDLLSEDSPVTPKINALTMAETIYFSASQRAIPLVGKDIDLDRALAVAAVKISKHSYELRNQTSLLKDLEAILFIHPHDAEIAQAVMNTALRAFSQVQSEHKHKMPDGSAAMELYALEKSKPI